MPKFLFLLFACFLMGGSFSQAQTSFALKDNSDIPLHLSQTNYNRLHVSGDKIVEAVFPPNAMGIRQDRQDGSVYILLASSTPFTVFLSTEKGHHFSLSLQGEEALGKTIEFIPASRKTTSPVPVTRLSSLSPIASFMAQMQNHKPLAGISIKRPSGQVERLAQGLSLWPKERWEGQGLQGEVVAIYNGGSKPINLLEDWFSKPKAKAITLSKHLLRPKDTAFLYRVSEANHG